ncbi:MAG: hypothetical protein LUD03_06880 [Firmicutes bacterium]|nr:hypothetical protein [Bacillota bacterium]
MPILYKRVITKHCEFVTRTKCFYYNTDNAKKPRGVRMCRTGEGKEKRNRHSAYLKRKYEMYNNFDVGDLWITLTHRENIEPEAAHKCMTGVMAKLRRKLKAKNIPLVYYAKTEAGATVRAHHHILIQNTSPEIAGLLLELWQEYGNIGHIKPIYNLSNGRLITYILDGGDHKGLTFEKYSHSRNLVQPEVIKRIVPFDSFRETPRVPKAEYGYKYTIRKLYNGFPDGDRYIYQEYELVKVRDEE